MTDVRPRREAPGSQRGRQGRALLGPGCHGVTCSLVAVLFAPVGCGPERAPDLVLVRPEKIAADRTFKKRTLRVHKPSDAGALVIETSGVVLDLGGAELVGLPNGTPPDQFVGRGIVVRGARDVTIRNANIRGFKVAIYAEDAPGLTIENCDVSRNYRQRLKSTPEREHVDDWLWGHENDSNEWLRYGAGVYLLRCDGARLIHNRAGNGQNGICLVRSNDAIVVNNDMSFMSGWGLAMWRSSRCHVIWNRFDYCVRGYSHGVYERGQDSTGILVYEQCSDNVFAYNSATHGGDGFFLYAGNETVRETGLGGCNQNVVFRNDFSYAVANGIEATFSDQNVFVGNRLNHCRHGIWAGYSRNTHIAGNRFGHCRNGVSIEHGSRNRITTNVFEHCDVGIRVWWDDDKDLLASAFGQEQGGRSKSEVIRCNLFKRCKTAIRGSASTDMNICRNSFEECERALHIENEATVAMFQGNVIHGGRINNQAGSPLVGRENYVAASVETSGLVDWRSPSQDRTKTLEDIEAGRNSDVQAVVDKIESRIGAVAAASAESGLGIKPGPPEPPHGIPQGKENILVGEWGPYDFKSVNVHPRHAVGWESASVQVLGPHVAFDVVAVEGDVDVMPRSGRAPTTVTIKRSAAEPGVSEYAVRFKMGDDLLEATGVLMQADWDVAYYQWSKDVDLRSGDDAWKKVVAAEPIHHERTGKIDFVWGGRGPKRGLAGDYFAAIATTTLRLPAGRWRFRTVSDDGVRVFVDGRRVIDNWTWHVPTEDVAEADLEAGEHDIDINYFEIDGHAQLQFFVEPAGR